MPRPGAPLRWRQRLLRPVFDGFGVFFVPSDNVDLVGLDLTIKHDVRNLGDQSFAQVCRYGVGVILVQAQSFSDLAVG